MRDLYFEKVKGEGGEVRVRQFGREGLGESSAKYLDLFLRLLKSQARVADYNGAVFKKMWQKCKILGRGKEGEGDDERSEVVGFEVRREQSGGDRLAAGSAALGGAERCAATTTAAPTAASATAPAAAHAEGEVVEARIGPRVGVLAARGGGGVAGGRGRGRGGEVRVQGERV